MSFSVESANAGNIGNEEAPGLNVGVYTDSLEIQRIKMFQGTKPGSTGKTYFKCTFLLLKSENGHSAGDLVQSFETVSGSGYQHFDAQAQGRVKALLGAIGGFKTTEEINANVKNADLALACSDAQPFAGKVVSAVVTARNPKFPNVVCSPASGTHSAVPGEVTQVKAVVPPPVALERFPHPSAPGFFYDASGAMFDGTGKKVN